MEGSDFMSQEVRARIILAGLGLVMGLVPLVYALVRREKIGIVLGAASALICAATSAVGLPYLSVILAAGGFYLVYRADKKADEARRKENRAKYRKMMDEKRNGPQAREAGIVENRDTANSAWPPVEAYVDKKAAEEYRQLAEREDAARDAAEKAAAEHENK